MNKRLLLLALAALIWTSPAAAQLSGTDSKPGDACTPAEEGHIRRNASADRDISEITLICDGSVWQSATGGGGSGGGVSIPACKADMSTIRVGDTCDDGSKFVGTHPNFGWLASYVTDANQSISSNWSNAITICENLDRHGHTDWYLPPLGVLWQLYENKDAFDGFSPGGNWRMFWSSSEDDSSNAWLLAFDDGAQGSTFKSSDRYVRCVRQEAITGGGGGGSGSDTLASLSCANNEIAKWNGSVWACAADASGVNDGDKGDVTVSGSGATWTIDSGAVTSAKIADGTIAAVDLANNAVTSAKILDGTVALGDMAANSVDTSKIVDGTIAAVDLANNAVTSAKILDGTIATADIANSAVTAAKTNFVGTLTNTKWCTTNGTTISCTSDAPGGATKPGGHYFVLSRGTYNGSMNAADGMTGLAAAAKHCVNELNFYEWKGRENVTVNAETVRPWLCDSVNNYCENLLPSTSYAFAMAGDNTIGGATFTSTAGGAGPGNTTEWSTATTFGTWLDGWFIPQPTVWTGRAAGTSTAWGTTPNDSNECQGFKYSGTGSGDRATTGNMDDTGTNRWQYSTATNCDIANRIICIVDDDGTGTNGSYDGYKVPPVAGGGGF